ncbi:MAG: zinc ribbon domain-containing protein, partial [Promethearchaeota archaeon]
FRDSFKSAFNKKIFLVILLIGVCLPIGFFMLFIPAIIIFGFFIFSVFTYNMKGVDKPISEARRISKGNFWKILITFVINVIIIYGVRFVYVSIFDLFLSPSSDLYNSWLSPDTRNYVMIILYQILRSLIDILLAPLFICLLTSLFASSKAKKDLGYEYQLKYQSEGTEFIPLLRTSNVPYQEIQPDKQHVEEKFYCPFCGYEIKIPKKFCPECGESFSFLNE